MKGSIRILLMISFLSFNSFIGKGQHYFYNQNFYDPATIWEIGLSAGVMNCLTDLGGNKGPGRFFIKDVNLKNTRFCAAFYIHAFYNYVVGGRIEFTSGMVTAYDSILKNDNSIARYRYNRNLHFRSTINELSAIGEWYFLTQIMQQKQNSIPLFSPYLLAGVSIFRFKPETKLNDNWVLLQPLHTEGQGFREYPQRDNYKCIQFNFPVGMGIRYEISALLNIHAEVVHRILLTDYLDDVSTRYIDPSLFDQYLNVTQSAIAKQLYDRSSEIDPARKAQAGQQRGDPSDKDAYFSFNLKIGLVLNRRRR